MPDDEKRFATAEDLGTDAEWEDIQLPVLGSWARVRILGTPEVARLQMLPDLAEFGQLVAKLVADRKPGEDLDLNAANLAAENFRYQAHLAHLAVMDPDADPSPVPCDDCGFEHAPSLWPVAKTSRLQVADMEAITLIALGAQALRAVRPFSEAATQPGSREPVATGASTPPTSS